MTAERANVASLTQQMTALQAQARNVDESRAQMASLEDDARTASAVYNEFLSRLRNIDASMAYDATDVRVISHAAPPTRPAFPDYLIMLPAAFVLSLGSAGMIGYMTARPKGIIGTMEIESLYDVVPLGLIPLRTARTEALFDTSIEQLLNRLLYLQKPRSRARS